MPVTMRMKSYYIGVWRITEMSTWDREYIDLVAPGHITVKRNGGGEFAFGAFEAEIDCRVEKIADQERLAFSLEGWAEGDEMSGRGWAIVDRDTMSGWFAFHLGDESTFVARRKRSE